LVSQELPKLAGVVARKREVSEECAKALAQATNHLKAVRQQQQELLAQLEQVLSVWELGREYLSWKGAYGGVSVGRISN
jgi:hypothetical protein